MIHQGVQGVVHHGVQGAVHPKDQSEVHQGGRNVGHLMKVRNEDQLLVLMEALKEVQNVVQLEAQNEVPWDLDVDQIGI